MWVRLVRVLQWAKSVKANILILRLLWREWTGMRRELRYLRWTITAFGLVLIALGVTIAVLILRLD